MQFVKFIYKNWIWFISIIFVLAVILRLFSFANFDYYSDSYHFQLTAKFIKDHFSLDGFLGLGGEYYQPLFYKFLYSMFIAGSDIIFNNVNFSSHLVSMMFGIGSLGIFWILVKKFNIRVKLIAITIFSFSFTASVLGGFILSETTGLFFLLLTLLLVGKGKFWWAALIVGLAFMARAEFLLLLIPMGFYLFRERQLKGFLIILIGGISVFTFFMGLFVLNSNDSLAVLLTSYGIYYETLLRYVPYLILAVLGFVAYIIYRKKQLFWALGLIVLAIVGAILAWISISPKMNLNMVGFLAFIQKDWILLLGFIGLWFFKKQSKFYFSMVLILTLVYLPRGDFRFFIYTVPFLAVGSAFLLDRLLERGRVMKFATCMLIIASVLLSSISIFVPWHSEKNYEKVLAEKLKIELMTINIGDDIPILAYAPEPVYLETGHPSFKFWDKSSDWKKIPDLQEVLLILDQAVYEDSPEAYSNIFAYLSDKQVGFFQIDQSLLLNSKTYKTEKPVILILCTREELSEVVDIARQNISFSN